MHGEMSIDYASANYEYQQLQFSIALAIYLPGLSPFPVRRFMVGEWLYFSLEAIVLSLSSQLSSVKDKTDLLVGAWVQLSI